jgi:uncharacterized spore protein YtfJ
MTHRDKGAVRPRLFRIETVRGEPYHVGERTLIPVARIMTFGKARGTIGAHGVSGWGGGLVQVTPLSILEQTADDERSIPIVDATATARRGLLGAALATVLLFAVIRWLARRHTPRSDRSRKTRQVS